MSNTLKMVIVFSLGVGVGAIVADLMMKKEYEDLVEEEIESLKETRTRGSNRGQEIKEDITEGELEVEAAKLTLVKDDYEKKAGRYNNVKPNETVVRKHEMNSGPYMIGVEEFSDEDPDYEKITIYYHKGDDTFSDDDGEHIQDTSIVVSNDTASRFWQYEECSGADVAYVRNHKIETDYEIICLEGSYSDLQNGKGEE